MITFGLTGGICSGKSNVAKTFISHNIPMVDADIIARQVVEVGTYGWFAIKDRFGDDYINDDKSINRTKLGTFVFANKEAMELLNEVMSPLINSEATRQIKSLHDDGHELVGFNATLICEAGHADKYRPLIVVSCTKEKQAERLMKRNGLTKELAMARIESQMSNEKKVAMADDVIDSNGSIDDSVKQTEKVIRVLRRMNENRSR
jgi:dephospho-CoA kinase